MTLSQRIAELLASGRWDRVDAQLIDGLPGQVLTFQLQLRKYRGSGTPDDPRRRIEHQIVRCEVTGRTQALEEVPTESAILVTDETLPIPDGQPWLPAIRFVITNGGALGMLWANVGQFGGFAKMLVPGVGGAPKVEIWAIYRDEVAQSWVVTPMDPQPPIAPL